MPTQQMHLKVQDANNEIFESQFPNIHQEERCEHEDSFDLDESNATVGNGEEENECFHDPDEVRYTLPSDDEYESSDEGNESLNDSTINNDSDIVSVLRNWAITDRIAYTHVDSLLKALKPFQPDLPLSHKTLFKINSPHNFDIRRFNPNDITDESEFVYIGIERQLKTIINPKLHPLPRLHLQFNMDGLPLFNSSSVEFWPILGKVHDCSLYKPFIIAVYCGKGKPKCPKLYLDDFVTELNRILKDGIKIDEKQFEIFIKCFACDRPARSFVKCIKGHTGYYSCERCEEEGCRCDSRTVFLSGNCELGTDESFRQQTNKQHHQGISPLVGVQGIDMVKQFILEFMHLGYLGLMKKLLDYWTNTAEFKLDRLSILRISQRLMNMSSQVPDEFQKTTKSLGEIAKWHAVEYRFFVLYCGAVVLKDILPAKLYEHFLLFCVACRILSCKELYCQYIHHAELYLQTFVSLAKDYYGPQSQVSNMHNLLHVVDDVRNMDCSLSDTTAFDFENKLGHMKKGMRNPYKPLSQLCRQIQLDLHFYEKPTAYPPKCAILKCKKVNESVDITRVKFNDCELTSKAPNNTILLKNGKIMTIERMHSNSMGAKEKSITIVGKELEIVDNAFVYPTESRLLDIFKVEEKKAASMQISLQDVKCKMVQLSVFELPSDEKEIYVIPMLHMS